MKFIVLGFVLFIGYRLFNGNALNKPKAEPMQPIDPSEEFSEYEEID